MKPIPENTVKKMLEVVILDGYTRPGGRTERESEECIMLRRGRVFRGIEPL